LDAALRCEPSKTHKQPEQKSDQPSAQTYALPGEQVFPEGVALNEATGNFFVGSTTDGTVFRGNLAELGEGAEVFLEPGGDERTTAVGMKVDPEGRLFVAGGDTGRIFVYDTNTGELVGSFSNDERMTFVNDVALTPDGSA
jgi:sugar lactone lactonase YvrE